MSPETKLLILVAERLMEDCSCREPGRNYSRGCDEDDEHPCEVCQIRFLIYDVEKAARNAEEPKKCPQSICLTVMPPIYQPCQLAEGHTGPCVFEQKPA